MVELAVLHTWLVTDECTDGPQTTCACGLLYKLIKNTLVIKLFEK